MTNVMVQPPVKPVEERCYISDARMYDERELAFFKTRDAVMDRELERGRREAEEDWALIEELRKAQNNK